MGPWYLTPEGDARAAYAKGRLAFRLDGEKLRGSWRLVRMRGDGCDKHDNWLLIKHGYRMLARIEAGEARLYSRNGHDWTGKLGGIAAALPELETDHAWLDGEVVVLDAHGVSSFQALQNAFERHSSSGVLYFVFDLLYEGGSDLRALPLVERKQRLRNLLDDAGSPFVLYSEHLKGSADQALATACRMGLEGLIGKRGDAAYLSGRSRSWIKIKCRKRQEFVIGGYTDPEGKFASDVCSSAIQHAGVDSRPAAPASRTTSVRVLPVWQDRY